MSKIYVTKEGDHIPKIAAASGFAQYTDIWDHPDNADLKQNREPCVLNPGDHVAVPPAPLLEFSLPTGQRHIIVIKRPKIRLHMAFQDSSGEPLADLTCRLKCESASFDLTLDANGEFDQVIPIGSEKCTVSLSDRDLTVLVGHLTPVDAPSGQRQRLSNLGYAVPLTDDDADEDPDVSEDDGVPASADAGTSADAPADGDDPFRSAVEEFQCDNSLEVTGICDDATQAKLVELHGS